MKKQQLSPKTLHSNVRICFFWSLIPLRYIHKPTFPVLQSEALLIRSFILLFWSTQAEQSLLVVSLGVLHNSLLQRLAKGGFVFRANLLQVHLAA